MKQADTEQASVFSERYSNTAGMYLPKDHKGKSLQELRKSYQLRKKNILLVCFDFCEQGNPVSSLGKKKGHLFAALFALADLSGFDPVFHEFC
jgi:hypothetical protein